jgi:PST family polysaccharide transporter
VPSGGLGRAAIYATLATVLERLVALGIALYLPRHLPLDDFGRYAFVLAFFSLFQVLPDLGLESVLVTRLASAGSDRMSLAGRGAFVRLVVAVTGACAGLLVLALTADDPILLRAGAVWAIGLTVTASNPYRALLRAEHRFAGYLLLVAGQATVALLGLALVLRTGGGLLAVVCAVAAGPPMGVVIGRLVRGAGARLRVDGALLRGLVAQAWPLAGSTLAFFGAQQLVLLLLVRVHGAGAMGLFGGAQKLVEAANLLPQALMLSVLPALAAAPDTAIRTARDVARLLAVVLVPVALGLALFAEPVLVTILGDRLAAAAPVLRVYAVVAVLGASGALVTNLLVVDGRQRILLAMTSVSALVLVVLGVLLVPAYGAIGAAVTIVVGTLAGQLGLLAVPATRPAAAAVLRASLRPLAVGAVAACAATLLTSPVAGALVLAVVYAAGLVLSGTVTGHDVRRWLGAQSVPNSLR